MTGDQLVSLIAIFAGVPALTLAATWLLVRRIRDPAERLDSVTSGRSTGGRDGDGTNAVAAPFADADVTGEADGQERPEGGPGDPPALAADGETVVCRHCGAENRSGYRYCRWCVRSGFVDDGAGVAASASMTDRPL